MAELSTDPGVPTGHAEAGAQPAPSDQQRRERARVYKDALEERAEELERLSGWIQETTFGGDQSEIADELAVYDQHPADSSDLTFQRELQLAVKEILDIEREQIRVAMARRKAGTYGICEECGQPIDPERLKVRPHATLCITCQRERERLERRKTA